MMKQFSFLDKCCLGIDQIVRALANNPKTSARIYPARGVPESTLSDAERKHAAACMRVNHAGEICAQALYHGQGLASRSAHLQAQMQEAAIEEGDHLAWCQQRLDELGSHTSYLNPFWYAGAFWMGVTAGLIGDQWSLGFVVETERQVVKHLQTHLQSLPAQDEKSYKILQQMAQDEAAHRDAALAAGARELPDFIKTLMTFASKIMVKTAYRL